MAHDGHFSLYALKKNQPQLLIGPCSLTVILRCVLDEKAKVVQIFDFSSALKVEKTPKELSFLDRKKWAWQKRKTLMAQKSIFFFQAKPFSYVLSSIAKNSPVETLSQELERSSVQTRLFNAPFHIFWIVKKKIDLIFPGVSCPLFFIPMPKGGLMAALFVEDTLSFVRFFDLPIFEEDHYMNNCALDSLKHVQGHWPDHEICLIFCGYALLERSHLAQTFPKAVFLEGSGFQALFANPHETNIQTLYEEALVRQKTQLRPMVTFGQRRQQWGMLLFLVLLFTFVVSKEAYLWIRASQHKQQCEKTHQEAQSYVHDMALKSQKQQKKLENFLAQSKDVFYQTMRLQKLNLNEKRMVLHIVYFVTPSFDHEMWKDFSITHHQDDELILEGPSLFQETKDDLF